MKEVYLESIQLIERLHRHFLEVVKAELDRLGIEDINNVQSLILWNIGKEELTVGELTHRGYYLGSNVSYNLKKLVKLGYVSQEQAQHDRRSARVSLTVKGHRVRKIVTDLFDDDIEKILTSCPLEFEEIQTSGKVLEVWDQFWAQQLGNPSRQD